MFAIDPEWKRGGSLAPQRDASNPKPRGWPTLGEPEDLDRTRRQTVSASAKEPSFEFNRSARCSPTRMALAIAVSEGFTAPMLTKKLVSITYRLSSSCALQFTSSTELPGSVPKRHVPA